MNSFSAFASLADTAHGLTSAPTGGLKGRARVPGDKSTSHRSLMMTALAEGTSEIHGLLEGEDVLCTAKAMIAMGAAITPPDQAGGIWRVTGRLGDPLRQPRSTLYLGNSGTSARLLMGLIGPHPITATLTGDASLQKRPMGRVIKPLAQMGVRFEATAGDRLPLRVIGQTRLRPIEYVMPVASAQVKSAILLAGIQSNGTTTVIEPVATRDHTERMLRSFGASVDTSTLPDGATAISLRGGQKLTSCRIDVPGDPSSAAFLAVAALITPDSDVLIENVMMNELRGGIFTTLIEMGADITFENQRVAGGEDVADLRVRSSKLKGIRVPAERVASMIDEFPILAVAASFATGKTEMTELAELRVKESDRLTAMASGLLSCGVNVMAGEDDMTIDGTGTPPMGGAMIRTQLDHRIAMSFLVLGMATQKPVSIDAAETINTSFPGFAALMNGLGAKIAAPI